MVRPRGTLRPVRKRTPFSHQLFDPLYLRQRHVSSAQLKNKKRKDTNSGLTPRSSCLGPPGQATQALEFGGTRPQDKTPKGLSS